MKLRVTLVDTRETITIAEEQLTHPISFHIGNTVTVCSPLATIGAKATEYRRRAVIKQIIDNSTYTVVFNDGDETSLRRSSLCLQGIRLYQTPMSQPKIVKDLSTAVASSSTSVNHEDDDDRASIVAIRRRNSTAEHVFPALILPRKALPDYLWVRSFLDGKEYIVHKRDDVHPYKNNADMQSLCRLTSREATSACDKYIRYNQTPAIWLKKKTKLVRSEILRDTNEIDSKTHPSDGESDEETTEQKDSFVAQLFTFMDDRGNSNGTYSVPYENLFVQVLRSTVSLRCTTMISIFIACSRKFVSWEATTK